MSYYSDNSERLKANARERYRKNRDAILSKRRAVYDPEAKKAYNAKYYASNRKLILDEAAKAHRANPGRKYGLTSEQYWGMVEACKGLCMSCGEKMNPPCVDHDHKTDKVRGLLCKPCNFAVGLMRDNAERVLGLLDYMRKF